jgi:RNA polymerase sigma-70 factor, ECF subfamily
VSADRATPGSADRAALGSADRAALGSADRAALGSADRAAQARAAAEAVYRAESRRVFATLVRLLGDFDLAEEALADAFRAALEQWPRDGVPANPRAWLVSAGRFKAIDGIRRHARFVAMDDVAEQVDAIADDSPAWDPDDIEDDRLRLIFTCCHPALSPDAQVALTLREVCGLTTEEIARAFLSGAPTLAQRIVRAKAKIRDARIPYQVPTPAELPERLDSVLRVVYLVFNEGYSASSGESLTRLDLSSEAIRVGRLLVDLLPEPEAIGLLALMLLQESRRAARASPAGDLVLLADQDRSLWNREQIAAGAALVQRALASQRFGPYTLQAAIAAVHAEAPTAGATDWAEIVGLYDVLARVEPSPVVELNRAVAVAMRDGPAAALPLVDALLAGGELEDYRLAHAARADLCRRLGDREQARASYERALALTRQAPERRFLERRLAELA